MKTLFVDPASYSPVYDYDACADLNRVGVECLLATCRSVHHADSPTSDEAPTRYMYFNGPSRLPWVVHRRRLRRAFRAAEYLLDSGHMVRTAQREGFDVVHFNWTAITAVDVRSMRKLQRMGKRVLYTAHNPFPHDRPEKSILKMAAIYTEADAIITLTQYVKDNILRWFPSLASDRIHIVPHFSGERFYANLSPNESLRSDLSRRFAGKRVFAALGNVRPYKGLPDLLRAYARVKRQRQNAALLVVGKVWPDAADEVLQTLEEIGPCDDLVLVEQTVSHSDYLTYIDCADVLVQPYRSASQSGNTAFCYSKGKPLLSSRTGGLAEEVVEGETGWTCEPGSPDDLADTMMKFFQPGVLEQLRDGCLCRAHEVYDGEKLARQMRQAYEYAMGCGHPG